MDPLNSVTDGMAEYFGALYGAHEDPYALRTRWYEQRKRALLLAALPQARYTNGYEPGCGVGELTVSLAARCDRLLASDFSADAVRIAGARCAGLPQVQVVQQRLPQDLPRDGASFDLIVLSEVVYFLQPDEMAVLADACRLALRPGGTLVACDWRPDFAQRAQATSQAHATLDALGLPCLVAHDEDDFQLKVWCSDGRSVAQREGIR